MTPPDGTPDYSETWSKPEAAVQAIDASLAGDDLDQALAQSEQARSLWPRHLGLGMRRATVLEKTGSHERAAALLLELVEVPGRRPKELARLWFRVATVQVQCENRDGQRTALQALFDLHKAGENINATSTKRLLAYARHAQASPEEQRWALDVLEGLTALTPPQTLARAELALLLSTTLDGTETVSDAQLQAVLAPLEAAELSEDAALDFEIGRLRLVLTYGSPERAIDYITRMDPERIAPADKAILKTILKCLEPSAEQGLSLPETTQRLQAARSWAMAARQAWPDDMFFVARTWHLPLYIRKPDEAEAQFRADLDTLPLTPALLAPAVRFALILKQNELAQTLIQKWSEMASEQDFSLLEIQVEEALAAKDPGKVIDLLGDLETGPLCDMTVRAVPLALSLVRALTRLRQLEQAQDVLNRLGEVDLPQHLQMRIQFAKINVAQAKGDWPQVGHLHDELDGWDISTAQRRQLGLSRITLHLEQGDIAQAQALADALPEATVPGNQLDPLKRLALAQADVPWMIALNQRFIAHRRHDARLYWASSKPRHNLFGQILNEYQLAVTPEQADLWSRDPANSLGADPTTPAALVAGAYWRGRGDIRTTPPEADPGCPDIPAQVIQFWDRRVPPPEVQAIMDHNKSLNPDLDFRLFNTRTAIELLQEHGETELTKAFRLTTHVTGKADIFRLFMLWHEGGIYLDADEMVLRPLSALRVPGMQFVGYQEGIWSIGNNIFAAAPGSPVLRAAMDEIASYDWASSGEPVWLSLGPGALSRAMLRAGTTSDTRLKAGHWIMPHWAMSRFVTNEQILTYKNTNRHWSFVLQAKQ